MRADPRRILAQPSGARQSKVTHAAAAKSARERLPSHHDQRADVDEVAYAMLSESGRLLLALASVDPAVSGPAMARLRELARRYARHVHVHAHAHHDT